MQELSKVAEARLKSHLRTGMYAVRGAATTAANYRLMHCPKGFSIDEYIFDLWLNVQSLYHLGSLSEYSRFLKPINDGYLGEAIWLEPHRQLHESLALAIPQATGQHHPTNAMIELAIWFSARGAILPKGPIPKEIFEFYKKELWGTEVHPECHPEYWGQTQVRWYGNKWDPIASAYPGPYEPSAEDGSSKVERDLKAKAQLKEDYPTLSDEEIDWIVPDDYRHRHQPTVTRILNWADVRPGSPGVYLRYPNPAKQTPAVWLNQVRRALKSYRRFGMVNEKYLSRRDNGGIFLGHSWDLCDWAEPVLGVMDAKFEFFKNLMRQDRLALMRCYLLNGVDDFKLGKFIAQRVKED